MSATSCHTGWNYIWHISTQIENKTNAHMNTELKNNPTTKPTAHYSCQFHDGPYDPVSDADLEGIHRTCFICTQLLSQGVPDSVIESARATLHRCRTCTTYMHVGCSFWSYKCRFGADAPYDAHPFVCAACL